MRLPAVALLLLLLLAAAVVVASRGWVRSAVVVRVPTPDAERDSPTHPEALLAVAAATGGSERRAGQTQGCTSPPLTRPACRRANLSAKNLDLPSKSSLSLAQIEIAHQSTTMSPPRPSRKQKQGRPRDSRRERSKVGRSCAVKSYSGA